MLSINTNISSLITQRSIKDSTEILNTAIERMTTGYKINHAKDNAANYSISTNMTTQLNAYDVAADNVAMGMDMLNTASSNLELISSHLMRVRGLAEQASNGTYGKESLKAVQTEVQARMNEIYRIMESAEFNGQKIFETRNGIANMPKKTDGEFIKKVDRLSEEEAIAQGYTIIKTADELQAINEDLSGKYILMNDIDLKGYNWQVIGAYLDEFIGELNGNGFEIKNLRIAEDREVVGLFAHTEDAIIKNLGVTDASISGGTVYCGIIVGTDFSNYTDNNVCVIDNCYVTGTVVAEGDAGGIAGGGYFNISNCWADVYVQATNADGAGGIAGGCSYGSVTNCFSYGDVYANWNAGGIVGWNEEGSLKIENCYSTCEVFSSGGQEAGIISGLSGSDSSIKNCYWTDSNLDGVLYSNGTITSCRATTLEEILGNGNVDFFVGINSDVSSTITLDLAFECGSYWYDLRTSDSARKVLTKIDEKLNLINEKQVQFGAGQSRLESALESIEVNINNLTSSRSTIRDADIAEESSAYIRGQILQQAAATLMSTANQNPMIALQLL